MTSSAIPPSLTRSATACSTTLTGSCYKVHHAERRASSRADRPASLRSDHDRPIDVFMMERSGCSRSPKYALPRMLGWTGSGGGRSVPSGFELGVVPLGGERPRQIRPLGPAAIVRHRAEADPAG